MNNTLELYHNILFLKLRPLRNRTDKQNKYEELIKAIKPQFYKYQPGYEVDFYKPHTPKAKYYRALIKNEAVRYFNHMHQLIENALDDEVRRHYIKTTLSKTLTDKLTEVNKEINRLGYDISHIEPNRNLKKDLLLSEETYIYQYLKTQLVQLYLDLQDSFEAYLTTHKLDEEEVYLTHFKEMAPDPSFIKESARIELPLKKEAKSKQETAFRPIYDDLKPVINSQADYASILNPQQFADCEKKLYEYGIIDIEYSFLKNKKQSNHSLLAAVYKVWIANNYFRRNIIGTSKKLSDLDIRKYLDERYTVDTSQQFRRITEEQIEKAKNKLPWLDKIRPIS